MPQDTMTDFPAFVRPPVIPKGLLAHSTGRMRFSFKP